MFNSTLAEIPSTKFFQNGVSDDSQNKLLSISAFASPEEESEDSNNNEEASEEDQGLQDVAENITTVNPSLTALSQPPQNEQCPAGSPEGCYVQPYSLSARQSCQPGEIELKNVPDGPKGLMCAPIQPPQNQEDQPDPIGVNETLPEDNTLTIDESNSETTVTKSSPAACNSQGTLFDPATNMCKNPQSIQDCAKVMQRYDPNEGKCIRFFLA